MKVGLFDLAAVVLVLFVFLLPESEAKIGDVVAVDLDDLAALQDRHFAEPRDARAAAEYARELDQRLQFDLAVRVSASNWSQLAKNEDSTFAHSRWESVWELANILHSRNEFRRAYDYAKQAVSDCAAAPAQYCSDNTRKGLKVSLRRFKVAIDVLESGLHPKYHRKEFREEFDRRLPPNLHLPPAKK